MRTIILTVFLLGFFLCLHSYKSTENFNEEQSKNDYIVPVESTIVTRFPPFENYSRKALPENSFGHYLRTLPLKPIDSPVLYFNGQKKPNPRIYCSVISMELDPVDLQQCADAVMRLRGEYLFKESKYDEIHFNFLSDGKPRYFTDYGSQKNDYSTFRKYMKYIFSYANTRSLSNELISVSEKSQIQIGDVFIQKGNPYGHAVIVLDVLIDNETGEKRFLLGQSYMPAQDTQILWNPKLINSNNPWYSTLEDVIETPEWTFTWNDLKRFPNARS